MVKLKEKITVNMELIADWVTIDINSYYEESDVTCSYMITMDVVLRVSCVVF